MMNRLLDYETAKSRRKASPEDQIHRAILDYFRWALPHGWIVFHPANGGKRDKVTAAKLKGLGVVAGIPDLMIVGPECFLAVIEVKTATGRLSLEQAKMKDKFMDLGVPYAIARSIDDAKAFAEKHDLPIRRGSR